MAFTEFYCATTGSNLNAGSTETDAATLTYVSGSWVQATRVFTVASGNPVTDGVAVGDFASVYPDAATVSPFVGRVTARDATTITISATADSGTAPVDGTTNTTLKIGGRWKGLNAAEDFPFDFIENTLTNSAGDFPRVNFLGGTNYNITAAVVHANAGPIRFQGYTTTVGDGGKATFDGGVAGASYVMLTVSGANNNLEDLIFQNNGATGSSNGVAITGIECLVKRCVVNSVRGNGLNSSTASSQIVECETYSCNQSNTANFGGFNSTASHPHYLRCMSHDNSGSNSSGFVNSGSQPQYVGCVADTNGAQGFLANTATGCLFLNCDAYNNVSDGIRLGNVSASNFYIENCNLVKNGGWGIIGSGAGERNGAIVNCGFGSGTEANTSGTTTGLSAMVESGSVTYAAGVTPWVAPTTGDFRVNLAAAINAGRGSFTETQGGYTGTIGYPDIGAAQHLEAAGGGGVFEVGKPTVKIS